MDSDNIKSALAELALSEKKLTDTENFLADNIGKSVSLLANINPNMAMQVLEQLKQQLTQEEVDKLLDSHREYTEVISEKLVL